MPRRPVSPARGSTLIELMIAMAVLVVGLLAMWSLHMVGLTSTSAGRRQTIATALARELVSGLERLSYGDPLLTDNVTGQPQGPSQFPPAGTFGNLVDGSGNIAAAHQWGDALPVGGVRLDSELREAAEASAHFERRWSVWGFVSPRAPAGSPAGVKIIAVSVTWRDPPFTRPREVVLYTQVVNPASILTGLGANP